MKSEDAREEALFRAAIQLAAGAARQAFLEQACVEDQALRQRLEELIRVHEESSSSFLEPPLITPAVATVRIELPAEEMPGAVIGRYKLREKIGEGGCGIVYVAEQEEPVRRRVALKVIKLGMDTKSIIARFEAERQALAMMDHPNIAKVLDAGATEAGRPYFVMELVRGIKITEYCDQNNLSTQERLDLFVKVCQAIQHAHQKGIIHRDIKPSNILVTLHDGVPVPKVIDFGIAKATEGRLTDLTIYTELHQFIGTPAYMSPEQAEMSGLDIDTRSDIYSLGVLLYELLVGKTPFDAQQLIEAGLDEMRRTIREKEPLRPSTRVSSMLSEERTTTAKRRGADAPKLITLLRGDLDWIVMKALEKDRTRRYETANGLATDIKRHLSNEAVIARPPSAAYKFQKLVRRNKLAVASMSAVAVALVLGTVVSAWQAARATRARNEARTNEQIARQARAKESEERKRAEAEAARADKNAGDIREQMQRLSAANGLRLQAEGDSPGALLWFAKSLGLAHGDSAQEYLQRLRFTLAVRNCPKLLHIFLHDCGVTYAEFSPDSRRIVTASWCRTARVWDVTTGNPVAPPLVHSNGVFYASFSPDGRSVVTASCCGSTNDSAQVWSADSGEPIGPPLRHSLGVFRSLFSPDGRRILTISPDRTAQLWDSATGERVTPPLKHENIVFGGSFSPDGRRVVTASRDGTARVWSAGTGELLLTLPHEEEVDSASFSPDGQRIITGASDGARVWDAATGAKIVHFLKHGAPVAAVCFSPDGRSVLTGGLDQTARIWDPGTGEPLLPPFKQFYKLGDMAYFPAFSPDGERIVIGESDHAAHIWNSRTGERVGQALNHNGSISHAAFSPDNRLLLTASDDGTVRVWDVSEDTSDSSQRRTTVVNRASHSPDGKRVSIASGTNVAQVFDATNGTAIGQPLEHSGLVTQSSFSPNGRSISTASEDHTARIWDAATGRPLVNPLPHGDGVKFAYFSPDGRRLVTGVYDQTVRVWDAVSGAPLSPFVRHGSTVEHASFSADGQRIVVSCADGTARVWDASTGAALIPLLKHSQGVIYGCFSPDNRLIVTASYDRTARLWDAATGDPVVAPFQHEHPVLRAAFSRDGRQLSTFTQDGKKVWDLASDERPAQDLRLVAEAFTGREIDHAGSLAALDGKQFKNILEQLRSKYPESGTIYQARSYSSEAGGTENGVNVASGQAVFESERVFHRKSPAGQALLVDLSSYYNVDLSDKTWGGGLAALPAGRQKFAGTEFIVGGLIQLAGLGMTSPRGMSRTNLPEQVRGIKIGAKCELFHFLSAESMHANGRWVGSYRVRYRNGQTWEIPIICGEDIRNWWTIATEPLEAKRSVVAWTGGIL